MAVQLLTEGFLHRPIEEARTLVSLTIGIVALYFTVQIIGFEGADRSRPLRPLVVSAFGALLLAGFTLTIYTPVLRDFFAFEPVEVDEWAIVVTAVAFAVAAQVVISRYWREMIQWLVKAPSPHEVARGEWMRRDLLGDRSAVCVRTERPRGTAASSG